MANSPEPATDGTLARRYHRLRFALSALELALSVGYLVALLATGASSALAGWLAELTPHWWLQVPAVLLALGAVYRGATAPLAVFGGFWLPRRYGLLHQSFGRWLWDGVKASALGGAIWLLAVLLIYSLLRGTPWWWVWSALGLLAGTVLLTLVAPIWLAPMFYRLTPLPDGSLRRRLIGLGERLGVPVIGVWVADQSTKSRTANAAVTGLGRTRRIILFDTLATGFTDDEVEAVLAHELAHHLHGDIWRGLAVQAVITLGTLRIADHLLRAGSVALGLSSPADPAGLPLLGLIVTGASLVALPLANGWSRRVERQADDFALRATRDPEPFVGAMERLADLNLAERDPHPLKELFLYSHPSIGRRIARARSLAWTAG